MTKPSSNWTVNSYRDKSIILQRSVGVSQRSSNTFYWINSWRKLWLAGNLQLRYRGPGLHDDLNYERWALYQGMSLEAFTARHPIAQFSCEVLAIFGKYSFCPIDDELVWSKWSRSHTKKHETTELQKNPSDRRILFNHHIKIKEDRWCVKIH